MCLFDDVYISVRILYVGTEEERIRHITKISKFQISEETQITRKV